MKATKQALILTILICIGEEFLAKAVKDDDESNPYEFGFTIDGQQHRHEKKDEKGIIQGEFGFITADGIYHVTVYATDENGNFKILSMRNVRISAPLDGSPGPGPESGAKDIQGPQKPKPLPLDLPQQDKVPVAAPPVAPPITSAPLTEFTTQATIKPACASCGYVTTPKPVPGQPFPFQTPAFQKKPDTNNGNSNNNGNNNNNGNGRPVIGGTNQNTAGAISPTNTGYNNGVQNNAGSFNQNPSAGIGQSNSSYNGGQNNVGAINQKPSGGIGQTSPMYNGGQSNVGSLNQNVGSINTATNPTSITNNHDVSTINKESPISDQPNPLAIPERPPANTQALQPSHLSTLPPISVSDNKIQVGGKNPQTIPIQDKFPGMADGLPDGISEKDITDLLYKFSYEVGFHGHWEKGLKNGAKIGGYFVNGRDGVSRVVTYIADENGYRPKFKFVRLGLDSDKTPKEGTEKTFGLKSFEFVWYPIE